MSPLINDSGQFRLSGYRGVDDVTAPRRQPDRGIRLRQRDRDLDADPPVHLDGGPPRRGRGGVRRARAGFRWKHVSAERPARKRRAGRQIYYVRTDHIGRPVFATNDLGVKVWEAAYLPFGGVHIATGGIDLRFPGQWFQTESGLHQNWMRDYDPTTGRYIEADPLGLVPGPSLYGYAGQNPLYWTDPTGECPWCIAIAGRFAIGALAGGVGAYLNSGGCWDSVLIGAFAGGVAGVLFLNPTASSSIGSLLAGFSGSAGGQAAASLLDACSCGGLDIPDSLGEAWTRTNVDFGLAAASALGAGLAGAVARTAAIHGAYSTGLGGFADDLVIGGIEGLGAGGAEAGYGAGINK